jgi:hypothetical protein
MKTETGSAMDKLVEFAKIVQWSDGMVYSQESPAWFPGATGYYDRRRRDWTQDENILIHWLCYIVDRQSDVKAIWTRGVDAFAGVVDRLRNCGNGTEEIVRLLGTEISPHKPKKSGTESRDEERQAAEAKGPKMWKFNCGYNENEREVGFTPRFPVDKYLVVRTLCLLKPYGLSLVGFLKNVHDKWESRQVRLSENDTAADFVAKVSFAAYLLSYKDPLSKNDYRLVHQLSSDPGRLSEKINSYREEFNQIVASEDVAAEFDRWKGTAEKPGAMYSAKRLWCALRDDLRRSDFSTAWGDGFPSDRDSLLPHLEITADLWNERFRKYAVADWAKDILDSKYNLEHIGAWEIRGLYKELWVKKGFSKNNYFPMQTDIAFDFAPRMCDASVTKPEVCTSLCPFGEFRDGMKLCVGDELCKGNDRKYCPLLLYTCGHERDCRPDGCYIRTERLKETKRIVICEGEK